MIYITGKARYYRFKYEPENTREEHLFMRKRTGRKYNLYKKYLDYVLWNIWRY